MNFGFIFAAFWSLTSERSIVHLLSVTRLTTVCLGRPDWFISPSSTPLLWYEKSRDGQIVLMLLLLNIVSESVYRPVRRRWVRRHAHAETHLI